LIENIDIYGPSIVRNAARNFENVAIVTHVSDYPSLIEEMKTSSGSLGRETRWRLAQQAFALVAGYDVAVANTLDLITEPPLPDAAVSPGRAAFPPTLRINIPLARSLRYGRESLSACCPLRWRGYGPTPHDAEICKILSRSKI
jgi:phosphoribosylaminoimidazolecarboxamide formyltransferase / IMP cyclohydrolase